MIEIKDGWNGKEALDQHEIGMLNYEIGHLNMKLSDALERRARIQELCKHTHVLFLGQLMTCEVCGLELNG